MLQPEQLGPYKILKRIGRGGMGTVYEALNVQTNEPAAVKVLNPALSDEEGFRDRFEIEIETLKKIRHPNVVRLYGFGEQDEILYYAMELVVGTNLEEELQNGRRFTWRDVIQMGIKLCRALKLAHDHGIVHRDLKPANILLTPDDDIKLTDFGIAKLFGSTQLTSDGGLIGTAEYMSPEQAEGKSVNFYSDIYSLGGVLFAMLAGRPPFRAKSLPEVLQMQRFMDPPRVTQFAPDTPSALVDMLVRLLSKEPTERAGNAGILAKELSAMEHGLVAKTAREEEAQSTLNDQQQAAEYSLSQSETLPGDLHAADLDPNQPTRVAGDPVTQASVSGRVLGMEDRQIRKPLGTISALSVPAIPIKIARENRFLTVEEEEQTQASKLRRQQQQKTLLQVVGTLAVLLMLGLIGWLLMRAPTAEELFRTISQQRESGELSLKYESQLQDFVARFPDDNRQSQVRSWQQEYDRQRLEKKLRLQSQLVLQQSSSSDLVREFVIAQEFANSDPQTALDRYLGIQALYGSQENVSDEQKQVLLLVKQRIDALQKTAAEQTAERQRWLNGQLEIARGVLYKDREQALGICRGIVALYHDRAWASAAVTEARKLLTEWESMALPVPLPMPMPLTLDPKISTP